MNTFTFILYGIALVYAIVMVGYVIRYEIGMAIARRGRDFCRAGHHEWNHRKLNEQGGDVFRCQYCYERSYKPKGVLMVIEDEHEERR